MSRKYLRNILVMFATMVVSFSVLSQTYDRSAVEMFKSLQSQPTTLARYLYLNNLMPHLSTGNRIIAQQMSSFSLSELGLYTHAVLAFPLKIAELPDLVLPKPNKWRAENAVTAIEKLAEHRQLVMINEVHHNAQTRVLTLEILPHLRKLGFEYLAIEALGGDPELAQRGYPLLSSGTEYLHEPVYGELVREAIRLNYKIISYDAPGRTVQARESAQAKNLYEQVFKRDPQARLVVTGGYAHIDKSVGRLGKVRPMAMILASMSGVEPLSIDQARFVESDFGNEDAYHRLSSTFQSKTAEILLDKSTGEPWSAEPEVYDVSVILPPALDRQAFGQEEMIANSGGRFRTIDSGVHLTSESHLVLNNMQRPGWLTLNGRRFPFPVDTRLCRNQIPCVVDAHYSEEPDTATPADIYAFLEASGRTNLYLQPGRYRLRATNSGGVVLSKTEIAVSAP